jgi:hypothetical protein
MKKSILIFIAAVLFLAGCGEGLKAVEADYTIRVTGSEKQEFSGHYTIAGTGAVPKPVDVAGAAPREYAGRGMAAACIIRKTTAEGTLKVEILKGAEVVAGGETAQPFGIITIGKIPDRDSIINQVLGKILG